MRTEEDVAAVKQGLADGTIDIIASDHAPHSAEEKSKGWDNAPFGLIGLETTLGLILTHLVPRTLSLEQAIEKIKEAIRKTYGKRGDVVVKKNFEAVDSTLENLQKVDYPDAATATHRLQPIVPDDAPDFVKRVTAIMLAGKGDQLPVSAFPVDGT